MQRGKILPPTTIDLEVSKPKEPRLASLHTCGCCFSIPLDPVKCASCEKISCRSSFRNRQCPTTGCKDTNYKELCRVFRNSFAELEFECTYCSMLFVYENFNSHYLQDCKAIL